ncbi:hypothetical protein K6L09_45840, partial [Burkholderia cepacia]
IDKEHIASNDVVHDAFVDKSGIRVEEATHRHENQYKREQSSGKAFFPEAGNEDENRGEDQAEKKVTNIVGASESAKRARND